MNETNHTKFKKRAAALAVASCMSFAPWFAEAAGLGKLTVLSALGQPLRAELDIGATKDELAGMTARLAPQDAFKQAGVDFTTVLLDLRFSVEKRANGQSVVKVSSAKPINEPFLDFLVELNWPAGRLVREYTFLLDPPEIAATQASRQVAEARIVETVRGGGAAEDRPAPLKAAAARPAPAPAPKVAAEPKKAAESNGTRVVRQGETLRKIADESKYDGVSLEQMLIGLFQSNPDAFIGQNVNRLKSGAILNIPEKSSVEAVSPAEARKIYVAQAADWNAYRQKLAASTAKTPAKDESAGAQVSSGKITAKVEEKAAPAEQSKDQVKVARTDAAAKGAAAAKAAEVADQVAKDKALKEAQDRMATLEKNVNELQKLLEMKNQKLAELQQPPVKKEEPKAPEAAKPVEPPKPAEAAKPAPKVEEPPKPVEPPKVVEEAKPVEPVKPVEPPKPPEAPKADEKPKVVTPPPAPVPAPVAEESLLDDPLPLVAGGGILALLAGYFLLRRRRSQSSALETTAAPMPSSLGPNSVFRMTGGQSVDTGNTPPQTGEFSQTGPGTIDTDEVDPVAEADVYMAYGRDTQAEEILLEALQKDPQRTAIHAKLLEIYANRRSLKQFETLASELYAQTAGVGPDWEKVAALGVGLDPNNPLYSGSRASDSAAATLVAASVVALELPDEVPEELPPLAGEPEPLPEIALSDGFERDTMVLPKETEAQEPQAEEVPAVDEMALSSDAMTLDFDLGEQTIAPEIKSATEALPEDADLEAPASIESNALDFDLGNQVQEQEIVATVVNDQGVFGDLAAGVDFDLDVAAQPLLEPEQATASTPDFSPEGTLVMPSAADTNADLDVGLGTWVGAEGEPGITMNDQDSTEAPSVNGGSVDTDSLMAQTIVNPMAGTDSLLSSNILSFGEDGDNSRLSETQVNVGAVDADSLEFDVKLTDSMFLGQPMIPPEFDIGSINLDLAAEPAEATVAPAEVPAIAEAPSADVASHDAQWEEVNTKLDLAKAYEEMGDLEGARELLQEVVGEGSVDLVEQARTILARIGG